MNNSSVFIEKGGAVLNKYKIIDSLASTPNSELELAYDEANKRLCVIKKIIKGEAEPYLSFIDINHPNLARIYEVDTQDNTVVMEYVEGAALPPDRLMTENEVRRIGVSLCLALDELHKRNIIHRDIKPSNIIMTNNGNIKIIDYGTARVYKEGKGGDTRILGTKGYAPPEQFGFGQTDFASDIYNVGVTMLRLLTGGIDEQSLNGYNGALKLIIKKCMNVDPAMRFSSADELRRALLGEVPTKKRKKSKLYTLNKIIVIVFGFLCLLGALTNLSELMKSDAERSEEAAAQIQAYSGWFTDESSPVGASSLRLEPYKEGDLYNLKAYVKVTKHNGVAENERVKVTLELFDKNRRTLGSCLITGVVGSESFKVIDGVLTDVKFDDGEYTINDGKISTIQITDAETEPYYN